MFMTQTRAYHVHDTHRQEVTMSVMHTQTGAHHVHDTHRQELTMFMTHTDKSSPCS